MLCLLFTVFLEGWRYDGFVAERPVPSRPNSRPEPVPLIPVLPSPGPPPTREAPKPEGESTDQRPRNATVTIPPPSKPRGRPENWTLADSSGQVWEHPDPDWLKRWVGLENDRLRRLSLPESRPSYKPPTLPPSLVGPCPPVR